MQINSRQIRTHELSSELISSVIAKLKLGLVVLLEVVLPCSSSICLPMLLEDNFFLSYLVLGLETGLI